MGRTAEYGRSEENIYGWDETKLGPLPDKDRIQLQLSPLALQTLEHDSSILFHKVNHSGFVNKLIHCYFRSCFSNVEEALRIRRQKLEIWVPGYCETLASKRPTSKNPEYARRERISNRKDAESLLERKNIEINMYLALYRQELMEKLEARCSKGTANLRITLDAESKNILYTKQDYTFRKSEQRLQMRKVLSAMVEEFTELGNLDREGILYAGIIQNLQDCCPKKSGKNEQTGEVINFRYFDGTKWLFYKNIRPFAVASSVQNQYYYLYAIRGTYADKLRISRIEENSIQILETPHKNAFTDKEIEELRARMSGEERDVADFDVYLDPEGVRMFEQVQYLRPVCRGEGTPVILKGRGNKDGRNGRDGERDVVWKCYHFHAAAYDIRNYFIRLLPHAVVVDQTDKKRVHDEMLRIIRSAERSYSNPQFTQSEN